MRPGKQLGFIRYCERTRPPFTSFTIPLNVSPATQPESALERLPKESPFESTAI